MEANEVLPAAAEDPPRERQRLTVPLVTASILVALAAGLGFLVARGSFGTRMANSWEGGPARLWSTLAQETFMNPWFYVVFLGVLLLERWIPADPEQPSLSRGLAHDAVWVPVTLAAGAFLLPLAILVLRYFYDRFLPFLTIESASEWPTWIRVLVAILFTDFLFWASHYIRHKVMVFWHFHAVHHSQTELNFLSEYRRHPLDDIFLHTVGFIPFFMLEHSYLSIVTIVWIRHWHTRVYHANIRSNFGWLRYILVTPQSHRVHHSVEPEHHDKNFGLTFSIWDHLFGTQYRGYDEYPKTGIDDHHFPVESGSGRWGLLGIFEQLAYPFQAVARRPPGGASPAG